MDRHGAGATLRCTPPHCRWGPILSEMLFQQKETVVFDQRHPERRTATSGSFGSAWGSPTIATSCWSIALSTIGATPCSWFQTDLPDPRRRRRPRSWHRPGDPEYGAGPGWPPHGAVHLTQRPSERRRSRCGRAPCARRASTSWHRELMAPPRQLVDRLHADPRAVLLGTASFWEGVDMESGHSARAAACAACPSRYRRIPSSMARGNLFNKPVQRIPGPVRRTAFSPGVRPPDPEQGGPGRPWSYWTAGFRRPTTGDRFLNALPPCTVERSSCQHRRRTGRPLAATRSPGGRLIFSGRARVRGWRYRNAPCDWP